jgi:Ca2+/H+ antiporter
MLAESRRPHGTMILTLAAVLVEVVILAIMMSNEPRRLSCATRFIRR